MVPDGRSRSRRRSTPALAIGNPPGLRLAGSARPGGGSLLGLGGARSARAGDSGRRRTGPGPRTVGRARQTRSAARSRPAALPDSGPRVLAYSAERPAAVALGRRSPRRSSSSAAGFVVRHGGRHAFGSRGGPPLRRTSGRSSAPRIRPTGDERRAAGRGGTGASCRQRARSGYIIHVIENPLADAGVGNAGDVYRDSDNRIM
jgi:hypothetical protein